MNPDEPKKRSWRLRLAGVGFCIGLAIALLSIPLLFEISHVRQDIETLVPWIEQWIGPFLFLPFEAFVLLYCLGLSAMHGAAGWIIGVLLDCTRTPDA